MPPFFRFFFPMYCKSNQIGRTGAESLAILLMAEESEAACNLIVLNLSNNRIRDEGASAMGQAIAINTNLRL